MVELSRRDQTSSFLNVVAGVSKKISLDPILTGFLLLIVLFGLVVLYSALGRDLGALGTQSIRLLLGLAMLVVASLISPLTYFRLAPVLYVVTILLLIAVAAFGDVARGSQRWLDLPGLPRFQPSELLKISIPLMMAWFIGSRALKLKFLDYVLLVLIVAVPLVFVFFQPDYGTAMMLLICSSAILFVIGLNWKSIATIFVLFAASLPIVWNYVLYDYHRLRILTVFDPNRDPQGAGWNIIQSKTAVGSGGLTGKGLFEGTQSQLEFLPEGHTDFVLAVIGEELGFVFCATLLVCYFVIFARGIYLSVVTQNGFSQIAIFGITLIFFAYVIVNVAMVLGLLPVVGLPLPLVSYGGTSAMTTLASFGIVMTLCTKKDWTNR